MNKTELERRTRKVAKYHLSLFLLPILSLLYYGWWSSETLNQRPDNPQSSASLAQRGRILDRDGSPLAETVQGHREYSLGQASGNLIGYQLRGKNRSGLESSLRNELSPVRPPKTFFQALETDRQGIHQKGLIRRGPDRKITLDSRIQAALFHHFTDYVGAFVLAKDNGEILSAITTPCIDPNTIAEDWQSLQNNSDGPFIERVGHGLYPVLFSNQENLVTPQTQLYRQWTSDNPFPAYPGASSALDLDGRLLVTPLMMLQVALRGVEPVLILPRIDGQSEASSESELTTLGDWETLGGRSVLWLQGPPFRDSPRFTAILGRFRSGQQSWAFALVVESSDEAVDTEIRNVFLPKLYQLLEG